MTNIHHSIFLSARRWFVAYNNSWIWIGVNDINEEGKFVNMLNERINYTNWAKNEPKSYFKIYKCDCVRIVLGTGYFATPCSISVYALCSQRYDIGKYSECQWKEAG